MTTPVEDFLAHLAVERRVSAHTLDAYRRDLAALSQWADSHGEDVSSLQSEQLRGFVAAEHRRGLSPKSLQRRLSACRSFYAWLLKQGRIAASPAAGIRESLEALPEKSGVPWFTLALATFVIGGFAWGFWQGGIDVGSDLLLQWVLATGVLGAIGCAIAGGHPLSIIVAFLASPITPLHPALASGTLSALTEAWLRKPTYADFMALRGDVQTVRGWWRNRVARVLLNFFLTSLGTAIGVWTGGLRMLGTLV